MSRKVFTAGEVLAAADVNSFLMDQTVMSFAGTAARGSAIGTATEGMVSFLEDSNLLSIYEGGVWRPSLASTGGILQVVTAATNTRVQSTTATLVDTGLTATITPKSASSQILVLLCQNGVYKANSAGNATRLVLIWPNGTSRLINGFLGYTGVGVENSDSVSFIDNYSSGATSPITFKTQFANQGIAPLVSVQESFAISTITLLEIAS